MNIRRVELGEALDQAHDELIKLSSRFENTGSLQPQEVKTALKALRQVADDLDTSNNLKHKSIKEEHNIFKIVEMIRNSPNFQTALGVYQLEFAGLFHRIETIMRESKEGTRVSKVELDRLEPR